ncbi:MAG TPA: lysophospholipid acyltransferase family protein [Labilithrix sp.]|nr:lysophospholipid acyltransferase family protein [Labilithrix sp.]
MPKNALAGIYTYAQFAVCFTAFMPVMALSSLRHRNDPTQRVPGRWMRRLGRTTSRLTPLWSFEIEGTPPADIKYSPYVVIANHESQADAFLLSYLPFDMRYVAKEELFTPPVSGWVMRWGGDIRVRRGEGESVRAMMAESERALTAGIPVMIFPEGTRSRDGNLLPFKDGAFALAIRMQLPILPIALAGTREMRPKHSLWFEKAHARARILEPISTRGLGPNDIASLRDKARARIEAALPELRATSGRAAAGRAAAAPATAKRAAAARAAAAPTAAGPAAAG